MATAQDIEKAMTKAIKAVSEKQQQDAQQYIEQAITAAVQAMAQIQFKTPEPTQVKVITQGSKKLPTFGGKESQCLRAWLEDIKNDTTFCSADAADQVRLLLTHLTDEAKRELECHADSEKDTVEKVESILTNNFGPRDFYKLQTKFFTRAQGESENVQTYARDLYNVYQDCAACAPPSAQKSMKDMQNSALINQFVERLYSAQLRFEMKRYILDNEKATFDEVRKRAMQLDNIEDRSETEAKQAQTFSFPATLQQPQQKKIFTQQQSNSGHDSDRLSKLEQTVSQMHDMMKSMQTFNRQPRYAHGPMRNSHDGNANNDRRCFLCNEPGHVQRFCTNRRSQYRNSSGRGDSHYTSGTQRTNNYGRFYDQRREQHGYNEPTQNMNGVRECSDQGAAGYSGTYVSTTHNHNTQSEGERSQSLN